MEGLEPIALLRCLF